MNSPHKFKFPSPGPVVQVTIDPSTHTVAPSSAPSEQPANDNPTQAR